MNNDSSLPRRSFLRGAASCMALSTCTFDLRAIFSQESQDVAKSFDEIRANLLQLVNEERAVEKVSALSLDELATRVANKHAMDMATGKFTSHWGRDGLKPYQRYSFAGGIDATQENISAADNTWSERPKDLTQDTAYLHIRLYQEKAPNDGHPKTILAPHHTHVVFGLAV